MNKFNSAYVDVEFEEVIYTWEMWMDFFARKNNDEAFLMWTNDKWLFSTNYLIIEEEDCITVAHKKNYRKIEIAKVKENFKIEYDKPNKEKSEKIFGFGNIEVNRKVKV